MMMILSMAMLILTMSFMVMMMASILSKKTLMDREKSSPFECGFDPKSSSRLPFSLQFFLVAVIFLIFDVEITLLIPLIVTMKLSNLINYLMISTTFLAMLLIGLYHEWKQGALTWAN